MPRTWIVSSGAVDASDTRCYVSPGALRDRIVALWNHEEDAVIGHWENFRWEGFTLLADFKPLPSLCEHFPLVWDLLCNKTPLGASILITTHTEQTPDTWHVTRIGEISLVPIPSNPDCYEYLPT